MTWMRPLRSAKVCVTYMLGVSTDIPTRRAARIYTGTLDRISYVHTIRTYTEQVGAR